MQFVAPDACFVSFFNRRARIDENTKPFLHELSYTCGTYIMIGSHKCLYRVRECRFTASINLIRS